MTGVQIRLAEIIEALSKALDMTEGQPEGHCIRCCYIGMHVGREIGLDDVQLHDLYYTLLLKDLGCSSNAARICELYLADDLNFKRDFKLVDGSLTQVLRFVISHTGMQSGLAERFRSILNILQNGGELSTELIQTRCQRGAEIARQMRFSESVAQGILGLDEHWNGGGKPNGLAGDQIPLFSRIALLAQVIDIFHVSGGRKSALKEVKKRKGDWFDPSLVKAFVRVSENRLFWDALSSSDVEAIVLASEPGQHAIMADDDYLDDIAAGFAKVIDAKSPYTSGHSDRVALFTDLIAEEMGIGFEARRLLKRAALLHDVGKLGVSNSVLDKPGKLDEDEWLKMKRHAEFSEHILSTIGAFSEAALIGGAHHERLDGKGYPRGLMAENIPMEVRIVSTADVFDALTADRPYRAAMPIAKALAILWEDAGKSHDPICIEALERALAKVALGDSETRSGSVPLQTKPQAA
ncbi:MULTISPECIES: HD-GYP domain-containing protein [unclassified Shinella]|jgi:HD-GYP domain-containing protein (c-di-GMP phosphodiesterase class II)|uniref:HD-GYP domain-containing protein n=2 Tax=Shinella TaxID=323620 RepID=UPI00102D6161|nr:MULTISPECIES: HD-GYP domain-containing protein [unclassified Shinella]MCO5154467.1 HD domain-containing protein [Shinella sp.]MDC7264405.1 HD domain-containing protein [Shinella sp. HY16]MDC7271301.1 HD domain-containing protein [Shinella sp. YZ44]MDG4675930.1 HD domain-containing phosphohydrolase [Shinella sp. 838]TAA53042.1 HD-GYP domain-containing protein [Shinella sp. JR1-6]